MNTVGSHIMIWGIEDQILESHLLSQTHRAGIEVRRRCSDAVELVAAAAISPSIPVLVSAQLPRISPEVLGKIAEDGRKVIVITHSEQQEQLVRSWNIGVVRRIEYPFLGTPDLNLEQLLESETVQSEVAETERSTTVPDARVSRAAGQVVCMWSAIGSTGRSTLALGLAESWAKSGERVLLIDADTYAPSLGTALGISDEVSGVVVACRYADHNALDERTLASSCREIDRNLWILTGISDPVRWPEIQSHSLNRVIDVSRMYFDHIVIDIAAVLPDYIDPVADPASRINPVRNGAGVTALAAADLVCAVVRPDAVGAARLVQDYARNAHLFAQATTMFLLNRLSGSHVSSTVKEFEQLCATIGAKNQTLVVAVPEDPIVHKMLKSASTMREVGVRSALFRSLNRLVVELGRRQNDNKVSDFGPFIKLLSIFRRHAYATASSNG